MPTTRAMTAAANQQRPSSAPPPTTSPAAPSSSSSSSLVSLCTASALVNVAGDVVGRCGLNTTHLDAVTQSLCALASSASPSSSLATTLLCHANIGAGLAAVAVAARLLLNTVSITLAVQCMRRHGTVHAVSVLNAMAFVLSGASGYVVFGEPVSKRWCVGVVLILAGVYLLTPTTSPSSQRTISSTSNVKSKTKSE